MANEKKAAPQKKEEKDNKKVRRPSALKRDLQSAKKNLRNRSFKSKVSTAIHSLNQAISQGEAAAIKTKLSTVFGLMDKGVKTGIIKLNKAARVKSQHQKRAASPKA